MDEAPRPSRLVGVLGGMGPAATADFYAKLIACTPAGTDQEHLRVVMWADPTVPSRQDALLAGGTDPTPWLVEGMDRLEAAGAQVIVVPCNTVHKFLPPVVAGRAARFISIIDATLEALPDPVRCPRVGLLATDGALASGIFQDALLARGYDVALPEPDEQRDLMTLVQTVKSHGVDADMRRALGDLLDALSARGAGVAVAGCTELSALLGAQGTGGAIAVIDPASELAKATVRAAIAE